MTSAHADLSVDEQALVDLGIALVSIPSPSGREKQIAHYLADLLRSEHFDVHVQDVAADRPNVIAEWSAPQSGPRLLFNGHLDTLPVDPGLPRPFYGRIESGRLFGAGAANMKGSLSAMVAAMRAVVKAGLPRGSIVLSAVIGECDALGLGTAHALARGLRADGAINGEPTELRILTDHAGVTQLDVTVHGQSVHVYQRAKGVNAIDKMVALLSRIDEAVLTVEGGLAELPLVNVGAIQGGNLPSMTAGTCSISVDVRSTGSMTPASIKDDFERIVAEARADDPQFSAEIKLREPPQFIQQLPYHISPADPVVSLVADAHREITGSDPEAGPHWPESCFGTDASHLMQAGIPTVIYGPGSQADIAQADEHIKIDDLLTAANVYARSAWAFLGGAERISSGEATHFCHSVGAEYRPGRGGSLR